MIQIFTYNAAGIEVGSYEAEQVGMYDQGPALLRFKNGKETIISMPGIITQCSFYTRDYSDKLTILSEAEIDTANYKTLTDQYSVVLYNLNGGVIRSWETKQRPSILRGWAMFRDEISHYQIFGPYIVTQK